MTRVWVLDDSAMVAMFAAYPPVMDLVNAAEAGTARVALPACAIAEASTGLKSATGWDAITATAGVAVAPLLERAAIEVGLLAAGGLPARHVAFEARAHRGTVVTTRPGDYEGLRVPLLVV